MEKVNEFLKKIDHIGKILTLDAIDYIYKNLGKYSSKKIIKEIEKIDDLFITKDTLEDIIRKISLQEPENTYREPGEYLLEKKEKIIHKIKILNNPGETIHKGKGDKEYHLYFSDRYRKLKGVLLKIMKTRNQDLIATLRLEKKKSYNIIGFIYSKKITKKNIILDFEDETGRKLVLVGRYINEEVYKKTKKIPPDSVIGLKVTLGKRDILIAKEVYLPSVKPNKGHAKRDVYAVFTSDLHIGSEKFLEDEFLMFVDILNGYTDDEKLRDIVKKIKYFVIAGDIVDGIGVFPGQEKELLITDIREQYKHAYKLLSKIRKDIKIIMIPGNHDASRKALPQPPILSEYAEKFYEDKRFLILGNPVNINIHNVNCYIYHGDFLQDMFTLIPEITQNDIDKAMRILLQVRHVAPTFGASTKIGLEMTDRLILPEKLDIFHTGHIHRINVGRYNDILIINSGTWQKQTSYQRSNGFVPTPGKIPIVNLRNKNVFVLNLLE